MKIEIAPSLKLLPEISALFREIRQKVIWSGVKHYWIRRVKISRQGTNVNTKLLKCIEITRPHRLIQRVYVNPVCQSYVDPLHEFRQEHPR